MSDSEPSSPRSVSAPLFAAAVFLATAVVTLAVLLLREDETRDPGPGRNDPLELLRPRRTGESVPLTETEKHNVAVFRHAAPSVVHVDAVGMELRVNRSDQLPPGVGTGFVWSDRGHIVTSFHLVENRSGASSVTLADGSEWPAEYVGEDREHDLAVLAIAAPADRLNPIELGSSADLQVGQQVFAIGNPFGLDHTLTVGVVSGLDRDMPGPYGEIRGVLQTDAAINPGNSGGPLLDSAGQLIGVSTAVHELSRPGSSVGFAIPVDVVNEVVPEILSRGFEWWPELGLVLAPDAMSREWLGRMGWTEDTGLEFGVIVLEVHDGGPAAEAGMVPIGQSLDAELRVESIRLGDVIVGVDGHALSSRDVLSAYLDTLRPGDRILLDVRRSGRPAQVELELVPR